MARTLLIVDDVKSNREILKNILGSEYDIMEASQGQEAIAIMNSDFDRLSAVLLDLRMPVMDGFEVLTCMRDSRMLSQLPVIVMTGQSDADTEEQALKLGAKDYISKPYKSAIIKQRIRNTINLRETAATVNAMRRDRLTGLYSREAFLEQVAVMVAAHEPGYYVMACFDIDKFKVINDQYGTKKGDEILRYIARVFSEGFSKHGGICCRVSADDFAVLYPFKALSEDELFELRKMAGSIEGLASPITFSIGRYLVDDLSLSPSAMYDRAIIAADTIKGRYDVQVARYDESLRNGILQMQEIVTEMETALRERQFEAWYQPQYNHSTGALIGAEALARWRHPQRGLVSPAAFIPVFEKNGFIYSLDKYIWEEVCRFLQSERLAGNSPLPLSVNISRYDVMCPDVVEVITGLVQKYEIPVDLLRLEITESAFAESTGEVVAVVKRLIDYGFIMEIDDFGSGYSSLNTLKNVPAQVLKLDMRFLEDDDGSGRGGNIIESIVRMAKWLGMSVIAEGVEKKEQADYLRSIGCNYIQGYLYARPMPRGQYETLCHGADKEEKLMELETVENLDNNAFWDPMSMDTLIFNSYVGGACIFEYRKGRIELLRATEKYAQVIGSAGMTVEDALKLQWTEHLDEENRQKVFSALNDSIAAKDEVTCEFVFLDLPNCPHKTYLRTTMRVITSVDDRYLVYCTNENITEQMEAEQKLLRLSDQMRAIMDNVDLGIIAAVVQNDSARYLFTNNHYYEMLGCTQEQFEKEIPSPYMTVAPEDRQRVMDETARINRTGESVVLHYNAMMRDGRKRVFRAVISMASLSGVDEPVQLSIIRDITEETETEQRERLATEQVHAIMSDIDSGITATVLRDGKFELLFSNDRYYQMRGYTREQYTSEVSDWFLTIHPDDRERVRQESLAAYQAEAPTRLEYRVLCRDGSECWVRVGISSTRFTGVAENVHLCIFTDIRDEKRIEREIKDKSEQLENMMNDMPGGFVRMRVNPDGRTQPVYINNGFLKLVGMSHDEVMALYGKDAYAGVHPDDIHIVKDMLAEMMAHGEARSFRYRLMHGNKGYVWVSVFGRVTRDPSGTPFLSVYYADASEQLKEEERQKELLDNLPGGAALYEYDHGKLAIVHLNRRYWELMERKPANKVGLSPATAIHPDDLPVALREVESAIGQQRDIACDLRLLHGSEGGYRAFHIVGRVVPRKDGKYAIYATFVPISDQKMSYQQMLPLLLSAIMESTTDLSFAKDTGLRYLSASRAFARLVGKESENDLIGKTDFELFDKEMAEKFREDDQRLLESGKPIIDMVEEIPSENGAPRYSSTSKYLLRNGAGEVIGLYGVGRDVTKSVVQDSQLKLVNDSIPGGLATYICTPGDFSPEHIKITYFNDGFLRLFGMTREEYLAHAAVDAAGMLYDEDHQVLVEQWLALMKTGTPINCLYRARVNGGCKWISHRAVATDRTSERVVINAILQDVTDQRELIEQLRISEEESSLAAQLGGGVICRYIIADRTLALSPSVAAAYSLPERLEDVPYAPVRDGMISPESADAYTGFFEAILSGSKAGTVLYQQRYLGGWRWMEAKSSTIFGDDGKPVKAVISMFDVTERLEKETVYKKWQQSLEDKKPDSYTLFRINLNNASSYDVQEGSLLTYDFDHAGSDFNTRALAYVAQCVSPEDKDRYAAFVNSDVLLANYYRGKRSGALEYRELTQGGGERWLRLTVDLVEYPNSTEVEGYFMYENIDAEKRAQLQTRELAETDPLTRVLNRTAFITRVERAIRAAKPGTRSALMLLDVDGFKLVNDVFGHSVGDQTLVDIADSLRGILRRDDLLGRLGGDEFTIFLSDIPNDGAIANKAMQICALTRKTFSLEVSISSSIGMTVVPRDGIDFETLYRKADAALYFVKGSGKDSCAFYRDDMADEHLPMRAESADEAFTARLAQKRRMLIVDDSRIDHAMLSSIFADDFIVEKAKDGPSALIRLRHYGGAISVVLLDLMMPGMDGFSVLKRMRENPELRNIPVIVVSGDEDRDTSLRAIREGAVDFVTKPVDPDVLRIRVRSAISKAENERLRAKNSILEFRENEVSKYQFVLERSGMVVVEHEWLSGRFTYDPSMSSFLTGTYDNRGFWHILLADFVADTLTVKQMQEVVHQVASNRKQSSDHLLVRLKTPQNDIHWFKMGIYKAVNDFGLAGKIYLVFIDLGSNLPEQP